MNAIPTPHIVRRLGATDENPQPIPLGNFTNVVHHVWNKLNIHNGINLSGFRHNLRDYYDENEPMSHREHDQIRAFLSDTGLQICVSPAGNHFRWDNRPNPHSRKCLYVDETIYILFEITQTAAQYNALQLVFMAILFHGLGDYFTTWTQPNVIVSPNMTGYGYRTEGGMKTEYAYFGGFLGGTMQDTIHYDHAKIRTFNSQNQSQHWIIPDHIARDYYAAEVITKFREVELRRNTQITGPTNTIRQLDICCGTHRLLWKPHHRNPHEPRPPYYQQPYYQPPPPPPPPPQGHWGMANQPPQQQPFQGNYPGYGGAPGTNNFNPGAANQYPSSAGNFGANLYTYPPSLGMVPFKWVNFSRPAKLAISGI
jgi:hypothetical protein